MELSLKILEHKLKDSASCKHACQLSIMSHAWACLRARATPCGLAPPYSGQPAAPAWPLHVTNRGNQ
jgi:hypothetical protein